MLSFVPMTCYMEYIIERLFSYAQSNNYSLQKRFMQLIFRLHHYFLTIVVGNLYNYYKQLTE